MGSSIATAEQLNEYLLSGLRKLHRGRIRFKVLNLRPDPGAVIYKC